ncbi:Major facilitator superfamily [Artemisia annua]|uniref:Major facilitator superfamily n=1 Tax=Artemisia annua TaxID=35608 RepID=A0A2U1LAM9_ARTAN|nr:Major facilitator superfamily [Artemisia annua]
MVNYIDLGAIVSNSVNGGVLELAQRVVCSQMVVELSDIDWSNLKDGAISFAFMVGLLIASPIFASLAKRCALKVLACTHRCKVLLRSLCEMNNTALKVSYVHYQPLARTVFKPKCWIVILATDSQELQVMYKFKVYGKLAYVYEKGLVALEHHLETFYSVIDKHVESTLNEMKHDEHALEHDLTSSDVI